MAAIITCPDQQTLADFVLGRVSPEQFECLAEHVERCDRCVAALHALTAEDELLQAMRHAETVASGPQAATAKDLMERLCGLRPPATHGPAQTVASDPAGLAPEPDATEQVYDFLAPAQGPGEIGRLGPYRVLKVLGAGGMGVVFQAEDVALQRPVALKVMKPDVACKAAARERFLREARAAAALAHDHIVTIFQVGEERGVPFLAMEWLRGMSLEDVLKRRDRLKAAQVLRLGRQVARGLATAHDKGLIHRDIKPANLWIEPTDGGRVKVLDFGLARAVSDDVHLTQSGAILGTPAYMAPEQARGEKLDPRCDLFSLGVVLYRMCTGQMPFRGETATALLLALATEEPVPVREVNPEVPPGLAELVTQLLAKDPARRPASAQAVADRLQAIEQGLARAAVQAAPAAPPAAPAPRRGSSRRLVLAAVALLVVLGGAFAAYQLLFRTKDGTLIVEVAGNAEVSFRKGELRIYDTDRKLKYTLKPSEKNRTLPPGKYLIEVAGVDGLKVDTPKLEIIRGGRRLVRVTVGAAGPKKKHPPTWGEWVPLFNGKDRSGWKLDADPKTFPVDATKQELVAKATGRIRPDASEGWIFTERNFKDFQLRFEFQLATPRANSGVAVRAVPGEANREQSHLEIQIADKSHEWPTGGLWWAQGGQGFRAPSQRAAVKPPGSWNDMEIELHADSLRVAVNGTQVNKIDLSALAKRPGAWPGVARSAGRIGLQSQEGTVRFRNIRIRRLAPPPGQEGR